MASTHKHIRSSTANKRPTTAIADGQIALNTNSTSPGLFFKDSTGATIIKVGPVHIGSTAPNATPPSGGSSGNSTGEVWLDTSLTPNGVKIWDGSAWVNATPIGSTTVQGLLELATNAETQTGADTARAVTPAGLQSKMSDSTSTTSSTTIASSTAVKAAYDLAAAALPLSGGTVTGNLEIGTTGSLSFEGATANAFETTIAVVDPTADRTITLPDTTGTVVTTGDTGTVTSTMIADGTIVDADISATAEIAVSKLADGSARQLLQTDAAGTGVEWASNIDIPGTLDVTSAATFDSSVAVTGALTKSGNNVVTVGDSGTVTSTMIADGTIVNGDINASAAIAGTKISPDFGSQTITTTGVVSAALGAAATPSLTFTGDLNTGIYSPGADQVAISTNGAGRLFINSSGQVFANQTQQLSNATSPTLELTGDVVVNASTTGASQTAGVNFYHLVSTSTATRAGARVESAAEAAYTSGSAATYDAGLRFYTSLDGSLAERLRITSAGLVGIGTGSPSALLHVSSTGAVESLLSGGGTSGDTVLHLKGNGNAYKFIVPNAAAQYGMGLYDVGNAAYRLYVTGAGNVGIGTTSPGKNIEIASTTASVQSQLYWNANNSDAGDVERGAYLFSTNRSNGTQKSWGIYGHTNSLDTTFNSSLIFKTVTTGTESEKVRIDNGGRLLVGTTTSYNVGSTGSALLQSVVTSSIPTGSFARYTNDNDGAIISLGKSRGTSAGSFTVVQSGDIIGNIRFAGADGTDLETQAASIRCDVDGTPGANDMPGRLVFSTTADGASSPTERMRIDNDGNVLIGTTSAYAATSSSATGFYAQSTGIIAAYANANAALFIGRQTNDGTLVAFYQAGTQEGTISVSGTTVSYNGAHLSRWSQLPSDQEREEILRGSVLSNIDEMCEWGDEDNEQLNRMKVSDVEGDKNVSGVFQCWDDDDDTYTNDFYCAMTGDFIIRIAENVTVERGDLLMSAGDGTAKPQDDDIIRSKTIAKVTSTHVSCTYEDGSYCVPCVLMAC